MSQQHPVKTPTRQPTRRPTRRRTRPALPPRPALPSRPALPPRPALAPRPALLPRPPLPPRPLPPLPPGPLFNCYKGEGTVSNFFSREDEPLGSGAFGKVYLAKPRQVFLDVLPSFPKMVALKEIDLTKLKEAAGQTINNEISIMEKLSATKEKSLHTIAYYLCFSSPKKIYIIMDLVAGQELWNMLFEPGSKKIPVPVKVHIGRQIATAIDFLHRHNIIHRDIKLENVMVRNTDNHVFLIDFGLSCDLKGDLTANGCIASAGTPGYYDPRAVGGDYPSLFVADWWSFGQLLVLLFTEHELWWEKSLSYRLLNDVSFKDKIPESLLPLITNLTTPATYKNQSYEIILNAFNTAEVESMKTAQIIGDTTVS